MSEESSTTSSSSSSTTSSLSSLLSSRRVDSLLWLSRVMTLFFGLSFFVPVMSSPDWSFSKTLIASALTSALRLHQRLPRVQLNSTFLAVLMSEDAAHYLLYSLIFLTSSSSPTTLVLLPVLLFALLHSASFSLVMLSALSVSNTNVLMSSLATLVEVHSRNILRMVATCEIFLMPITVILVFTGKFSLVTPFVYYRFLGLRYASKRNPYSRSMFHELRVALQQLAAKCPPFLARAIYMAIDNVSRLAPPIMPQQQTQ